MLNWNQLVSGTKTDSVLFTSYDQTFCIPHFTGRRHLEDKREMRSAAADQQVRLADALARRDEVERILAEERARWDGQQEEWQQFQKVRSHL